MKKIFSLLTLAVILFASCEGPAGRDGRDGVDGFVNFNIIDLEVNSNQWQFSNLDNNNFFTASFDMPEIDQYIYDNGLVQVYREYETGTSRAVQLLLPSTRHIEYPYYDEEGNEWWGFYTETTDYEYGVGRLNIFYTASDFDYEINYYTPDFMHFRVVIMW